ncbi:MAG: ATP-binding cassette domain-containing protein [Bacilli bacterium]|nr:ATP-binding cassette domain-containing protein [Bacilli bacterium]
MENKEIVLSVKDLKVNFSTDHGYVQAVRNVSFDLYKGETLCIVGESGSGKSVTNKAIMGILSKNGRIVNGSIMYEGEDLTKISEDEFHRIRGHKIGMIFQDPLSSLNPIVRIGKQITEGMLINASRTKRMYDELVADSLTAYRNAQTELKTGLAKGTENIKFLKSEKKKHIGLAKNEVSNEIGGRIYTAKQNYGAAVFELKSQEHYAIAELDEAYNKRIEGMEKDKIVPLLEEHKKQIDVIKAKTNEKVEKLKTNFDAEKAKILESKVALVEKSNEKVAEIIAKYDALIQQARNEYKESKSSLIAEYKPKIAIAKEKFEADSKVAKEKIKNYKSDLKEKYKEKAKDIKAQKTVVLERIKPELAEAKKEYYSSLESINVKAKEKNAEIKAKYAKLIKEIKNSNTENQKDKIAAAKKEFKSNYKAAKEKFDAVRNAARGKVDEIEARKEMAKSKFNSDLTNAKKEYISSLRITRAEAKEKALEVMAEVGIKDPEKRFKQYPFEFSGGMRQRIVIAIALTANPDILICDEPTTALDVTIQAQILELINKLKKQRNLSCIFITHDLGVVANMADRVAVMYAGKIVEYGTEEEIFYDPKHPYTWALLSSIPDVDSNERLDAIPGTPPNMIYPPVGDAFALRSKYAMEIDFKKEPPFFKVSDTHYAATWLLDPRAPKVEMPKIVKQRIESSLKTHKKGGNQ